MAFLLLTHLLHATIQSNRLDMAVEERQSAFFNCKSFLEELHTTEFSKILSQHYFTAKEDTPGTYVREIPYIVFHSRDGDKFQNVSGKRTTTLVAGTTGNIPNYTASITMEWTSPVSKKKTLTQSVHGLIYP